MKRKNSYVLDKNDNEAIQLFSELGMPKNLAKTLLYVSEVKECHTKDIERGADLRQPEVSVAMRELGRRGWVTKRNVKKKGKGRPIYSYRFVKDLSKIWKDFEQEKLQEIENVKKDLSKLKNIVVSGKIGG